MYNNEQNVKKDTFCQTVSHPLVKDSQTSCHWNPYQWIWFPAVSQNKDGIYMMLIYIVTCYLFSAEHPTYYLLLGIKWNKIRNPTIK